MVASGRERFRTSVSMVSVSVMLSFSKSSRLSLRPGINTPITVLAPA